jgi:hypothetical protein
MLKRYRKAQKNEIESQIGLNKTNQAYTCVKNVVILWKSNLVILSPAERIW